MDKEVNRSISSVREEEEEEGFDQAACPSDRKLEEEVREFRQEAESAWSLTSPEFRDMERLQLPEG